MRRTVVLNGIIVRIQGFLHGSAGEDSTCSAGDTGDADSIPGFMSTSSVGGHGNPLQCSCQKNPVDRGVWGWRGLQSKGLQRGQRDWATKHSVVRITWVNSLKQQSPVFFGIRDRFRRRQFFHGLGQGGGGWWFQDDSSTCVYCVLYF